MDAGRREDGGVFNRGIGNAGEERCVFGKASGKALKQIGGKGTKEFDLQYPSKERWIPYSLFLLFLMLTGGFKIAVPQTIQQEQAHVSDHGTGEKASYFIRNSAQSGLQHVGRPTETVDV
ncbi:hypothetical protein D5086_009131 [Populus alba]|uniref:Uncharacterized protein n=1 Tax=Populus alba TaxID=43335 RepID=A0ACC4CHF0_POPAL